MTVGQFIAEATQDLKNAGITTAKLDCLILLEDSLGLDRANLLAHPEAKIPSVTEVRLNNKIAQRLTHQPLAYIRGKVDFYGRTFLVNNHTLVPRPESEEIITLLKDCHLPPKPIIVDVGTGTGCLGITAALEIPGAQVQLVDIDPKALEIAKENSKLHDVQVKLVHADLLKDAPAIDVILANLPYVPTAYPINKAARHEPKIALFSGVDGLDLYRRMWEQITLLPQKPKIVITESLEDQHPMLARLARQAGYRQSALAGLVQRFQLIP